MRRAQAEQEVGSEPWRLSPRSCRRSSRDSCPRSCRRSSACWCRRRPACCPACRTGSPPRRSRSRGNRAAGPRSRRLWARFRCRCFRRRPAHPRRKRRHSACTRSSRPPRCGDPAPRRREPRRPTATNATITANLRSTIESSCCSRSSRRRPPLPRAVERNALRPRDGMRTRSGDANWTKVQWTKVQWTAASSFRGPGRRGARAPGTAGRSGADRTPARRRSAGAAGHASPGPAPGRRRPAPSRRGRRRGSPARRGRRSLCPPGIASGWPGPGRARPPRRRRRRGGSA